MTQPEEIFCCVDHPLAGAEVDPLNFLVEGWVWRGAEQGEIVGVEAWSEGILLGWTSLLRARPDVASALGVDDKKLGFHFFCHHPFAQGKTINFTLHLQWRHGTRSAPITGRAVKGLERDYRKEKYGVILDQQAVEIQGWNNIYNSGPSLVEGNPHVVELLIERLGPPPQRILDVGCGLGYYGRQLRAAGYDWMGVETKATDCAHLATAGLPFREVDGKTLPFSDASFDAAIGIEVLEHIARPDEFLAEIKRVAPGRLLVSVPNCEIITYLSTRWAVPLHMLEPDHKNFFTRWSLGKLLEKYYPRVEVGFHSAHPLKSDEGATLYYHLFACATS